MLYGLGSAMRFTGNGFHRVADALQLKPIGIINKRCGHRKIVNLGDRKPIVNQGVWIAPTATIIGSVQLGVNSTVWYGAVLRGDIHSIKVGVLSSIGDRCVIHVSGGKISDEPRGTSVGNNVIVEPGAILHACTVEDGCRIGSGSVIFDGAVVRKNSIVSPGSVVPMGKHIPSGELWAGNPAAFVRKLETAEMEQVQSSAENFYTLAQRHEHENNRSELEILANREYHVAQEDIWWGTTVPKSGPAHENPALAKYISQNKERTFSQT